jgi:hypothetical protein
MKMNTLLLAAILLGYNVVIEEIGEDCAFDGIALSGKVKVVDSFPDITVKKVTSFPDLKVKLVSSFADDCGEWQIVESFPDFTIKYVDSFADIEVQLVDSFPGLP